MTKLKGDLSDFSKEIRRNILKASFEAKACHIGSALSCVEILVTLYSKILKKGDVFIFSKASGASALYAVLAKVSVIPQSKISFYLKKYPLPSREVPGVVFSVGSLGHGFPIATGMALADRKRKVYCLISDGELDEGTTWETALFANHHNLKNLVVIIDRNHLQACGNTEKILKLEPLKEKWEAFGWEAKNVNGHNFSELKRALDSSNKKPLAVIADTVKGKGVDFMENDFKWHYCNLSPQDLKAAVEQQK